MGVDREVASKVKDEGMKVGGKRIVKEVKMRE